MEVVDAAEHCAEPVPEDLPRVRLPPARLRGLLGRSVDCGTREVDGKEALLFGPDVIVASRSRGFKLRPFLEHELFHVHHGNLHPDAPETIAAALWEEGLAT